MADREEIDLFFGDPRYAETPERDDLNLVVELRCICGFPLAGVAASAVVDGVPFRVCPHCARVTAGRL